MQTFEENTGNRLGGVCLHPQWCTSVASLPRGLSVSLVYELWFAYHSSVPSLIFSLTSDNEGVTCHEIDPDYVKITSKYKAIVGSCRTALEYVCMGSKSSATLSCHSSCTSESQYMLWMCMTKR